MTPEQLLQEKLDGIYDHFFYPITGEAWPTQFPEWQYYITHILKDYAEAVLAERVGEVEKMSIENCKELKSTGSCGHYHGDDTTITDVLSILTKPL